MLWNPADIQLIQSIVAKKRNLTLWICLPDAVLLPIKLQGMLKPLIFPCHRENRSGDSQEYYEFTIYFLDRNLPNMKSQKPHMVKKEKKKSTPKSKLRTHSWHRIPSLVIRSSYRSDAFVCVLSKKLMKYWNPWSRLGCYSAQLFTLLAVKIFFLPPFLGEKHPQQVFKVLLGFKTLRIPALISNLSCSGLLTHQPIMTHLRKHILIFF